MTLHILFQALSPAIFATLSDSLGRRPIYLVTLTLYTLINLGLALNKDSYAGLQVLRAPEPRRQRGVRGMLRCSGGRVCPSRAGEDAWACQRGVASGSLRGTGGWWVGWG